MDNRKNTILLTVIAIATLLVAVIGATFAYFTAQGDTQVSRNVNVRTETADSTMFNIDRNLTLTANQVNFSQADVDNDLTSDPVTGTATFTASTGGNGTKCYTLALTVTANDFVYSTNHATNETSSDPELTLTVTRTTVENNPSSNNINYNGTVVTVLNNIDITTLSGTIYIPATVESSISNLRSSIVHQLSANAGTTTSHKYVATMKLDNKNYDQQDITNKTFTGSFIFSQATCP